MADFVFNIAKGRIIHYASLPGANDALIVVPIETAGIEADSVLVDYDTLAALLAGPSNEQTTLGRKTLTGVGVTVDDINDNSRAAASDFSWANATGNAISKILVCYDADTTSGTDADIIPLVAFDLAITPSGANIDVAFNPQGFLRAK